MVNIFIDYSLFIIFKETLYYFNQEKIIFLMIHKSISFSKQEKRNYLLKNLICKKSKFLSVCGFAASSQNESAVL